MPTTPKRRNYTIAVKDLLPSLGQKIGYKNNNRNISLRMNWDKIVGPQYAEQLKPVTVKNNGDKKTLTVHCRQGAALQLSYVQEEICERVNHYFGKEIINRLHLIPTNRRQRENSGENPSENPEENRHPAQKPAPNPAQNKTKSSLYSALRKLSEKI